MQTPPTIKEEGTRWTVANARPPATRVMIALLATLVLALIAWAVVNDLRQGGWHVAIVAVRLVFALLVAVAARFWLFGAESIAVEGREVVWRRGKRQQRHAAVGDIEKLVRTGNVLRVHVRDEAERPIVVGAGLRQSPAAMKWLTERLDKAIIAARKGT